MAKICFAFIKDDVLCIAANVGHHYLCHQIVQLHWCSGMLNISSCGWEYELIFP